MKNVKLSQKLTESGLMLALTTILSIFAIAKLPYGGEITFASMLPMTVIAYRYGFRWGLLTGVTYGLIQMLLGLNNLSYATSAVAVVAIIMLDYILAFSSTAAAGLFRRVDSQKTALAVSAVVVCAARYLFHVISGCTVWAGLSIPTADALLYSLIYNATYMLPETVITTVGALYLASAIDFRKPQLAPAAADGVPTSARVLSAVSGFVLLGAVAAVIALVFPHLQNAETGEFYIQGVRDANFVVIGIIVGAALVISAILWAVRGSVIKKAAEE